MAEYKATDEAFENSQMKSETLEKALKQSEGASDLYKCTSCFFRKDLDDMPDSVECIFNPPTVALNALGRQIQMRPVMSRDDFCGRYRHEKLDSKFKYPV